MFFSRSLNDGLTACSDMSAIIYSLITSNMSHAMNYAFKKLLLLIRVRQRKKNQQRPGLHFDLTKVLVEISCKFSFIWEGSWNPVEEMLHSWIVSEYCNVMPPSPFLESVSSILYKKNTVFVLYPIFCFILICFSLGFQDLSPKLCLIPLAFPWSCQSYWDPCLPVLGLMALPDFKCGTASTQACGRTFYCL